ncbi:RICIN domain-containing protein [Streptomyces sp. NPDC029526]|uniref:RICIN domain-containing protein n=1 Tax=Streptomyces sp. NPDC029526 TaxID=3155728 RepID=UPI0033E2EE32
MKEAGVWNSPAPSRPTGPTDEQLSAELRKWTGGTPAVQPVGELLDRHWEAAFTYARLCTDGPGPAGMLTTAAFTRLFGETLRHHGPAFAWRPHLLVTVRRIAAEWDGDHRRTSLHPDLTAASRDGTRPAALLLPPPERRLLSGAFQRLPQSARCLLWHAEAESEPLDVPALLLGLDVEGAGVERDRARDRLREECLQLHRELAPGAECRTYQRMLDVTCRRAHAAVDPDLAVHLDGCAHCRHTADQLTRFPDGLGTALAEAVLGWGARAYAERRARAAEPGAAPVPVPERAAEAALLDLSGRPDTGTLPPPPAPLPGDGPATEAPASPVPRARRRGGPRPGGTPAGAGSRAARKAARRATRRRHLAVGALTVGAVVVLPLVLWSAAGSDEDGTGRDAAARPSATPEDGRDRGRGGPSRAGADGAAVQGALRGRLHNSAADLCVAVVGNRVAEDAETELTACSSAAVQQWTYERDGLLRNVARPDLCLDSRLGYAVRLAACADGTGDRAGAMRYDFTVRGALIPRSDQRLALAPAATDGSGALVLKNRTDDDPQRWTLDDAAPDLRMKAVTWDTEITAPPASTPSPVPPAAPAPSTTAPRPTTSAPACADGPTCAESGREDAAAHDHGYGGGFGYGDGRSRQDGDDPRYDRRRR